MIYLLIIPISFVTYIVGTVYLLNTQMDENKVFRWPILLFTVAPIRICKWFKRLLIACWGDIVDAWEKP